MKDKTLYTERASFTKEAINNGNITEDEIARNMAFLIIKNMDIDDLKKLFDFRHITPTLLEAKSLSEMPFAETLVYKCQIFV